MKIFFWIAAILTFAQINTAHAQDSTCRTVESGFGSPGPLAPQPETLVDGLQAPWGIAFINSTDFLVTERPGRVRIVRNGTLDPSPVLTIDVFEQGEAGLLGIAADPAFASNRYFTIYYTADNGGTPVNRVERYQLSADGSSATLDKTLLDGIPAASVHDGGRIHFGPDGNLYIGTGDARQPELAQDTNSLAGKILRIAPDGTIPANNPDPGNPWFIRGVRNPQGFDWWDNSTLIVTDHGPTGELGRTGQDEVSIAHAGDNLGWPTVSGCDPSPDTVTPILSWQSALPPGGALVYRGNAVPQWQGSVLIPALGAELMEQIAFPASDITQPPSNLVYFENQFGRLRDIVSAPDGSIYITTSNCDGRGSCPPEGDRILRIASGQ